MAGATGGSDAVVPGVSVTAADADGTNEGTTGNSGVALTRGVGVLLKMIGAEGAIIGKALYTGALDLAEAIAIA